MSAFDHFDFIAPLYDRIFHHLHTERLIEVMALPTSGFLLDAGGGTGRVAQSLEPHASKVIVADVSLGMLRQAAAKDHLQTVCAPSERLPFRDNLFDRIIMVDALHHVYNARQTSRELWRVLKPGGRLVIEEPDIRTFPVKIVALMEKMALMRSHFISPPVISTFFGDAAEITIVQRDSYTSWVIINKPETPSS